MIGAVKVNIADQQFFLHFFMRSLIIISVNLWVILNINYSVHFVGKNDGSSGNTGRRRVKGPWEFW